MSEKNTRTCDWQGYGGGAMYQDMGCAGGTIVDLDSCDEPGGPCTETGEKCPNCGGKGVVPSDHADCGPMALIRQRAHDELCDEVRGLAGAGPDEIKAGCEDICEIIGKLFGLVHRLEQPGESEALALAENERLRGALEEIEAMHGKDLCDPSSDRDMGYNDALRFVRDIARAALTPPAKEVQSD